MADFVPLRRSTLRGEIDLWTLWITRWFQKICFFFFFFKINISGSGVIQGLVRPFIIVVIDEVANSSPRLFYGGVLDKLPYSHGTPNKPNVSLRFWLNWEFSNVLIVLLLGFLDWKTRVYFKGLAAFMAWIGLNKGVVYPLLLKPC